MLKIVLFFTFCLIILAEYADEILKEDLSRILKSSSGVYSTNKNEPTLKNTVIITTVNFGYLNHFLNFNCFMERLKLKYLVFVLDLKSYKTLETLGLSKSAYYFNIKGLTVEEHSSDFRSHQFNIISNLKILCVHTVLKLKYDVIFIDPDIAVINDPVPFLITPHIDYVHSSNYPCSRYAYIIYLPLIICSV